MTTQGVNQGVLKSQGKMTPGNLIRIVEDNIVEDSGVSTSGPGGGGVTSFNTRTGAVIPVSGDYSVSQVTGAAPLASPTFTGTVTLPSSITENATTTFTPNAGATLAWQTPTDDNLIILNPGTTRGNCRITMSGGQISIVGASGAGNPTVVLNGSGNGIEIDDFLGIYNGDALTHNGNGLASIPDVDSVTAQAANYNGGSAKSLALGSAGKLYRISGVQQITRIATTSSTMPSLTLNYTGINGISRSVQLVPTSTNNTTATLTSFSAVIFIDITQPVTLTSAGYASSGATSMQYALAWAAERLI